MVAPMSRLIFTALLLTSCAAEVPPRADAGDPRVMPVGAVAALDGSFSEGDGLTYAWSVTPSEGAILTEPASPFASFTAQAPGFYTLALEVCDEAGRCDTAETWARVDAQGTRRRIDGLSTFAGSESGAGAPLGDFEATDAWCKSCLSMASQTSTDWIEFCRSGLPDDATRQDWAICDANKFKTTAERKGYCYNRGCDR